MKCPKDDVHLTNGEGFMVTESLYQEQLKAAVEIKQVRSTASVKMRNLIICRLVHVTGMMPWRNLICLNHIYSTPASARLPARGMDVSSPTALSTLRKVKSKGPAFPL